jgi:hypothetical protein
VTHPSKAKGDRFERLVCDYLAETVVCERIPAGASKDRGDLWVPNAGTIQCKDWTTTNLPAWWRDTERQMTNNNHRTGWVVHKRKGTTDPTQQWVTCDLQQLRYLLDGGQP